MPVRRPLFVLSLIALLLAGTAAAQGPAQGIPRPEGMPAAGMNTGQATELRLRRFDPGRGLAVLRLDRRFGKRQRKELVVVFQPEGGGPVVLEVRRWRGRRIEVQLPPSLRGRAGRFYLARRDAPGRPLSAFAAFRPEPGAMKPRGPGADKPRLPKPGELAGGPRRPRPGEPGGPPLPGLPRGPFRPEGGTPPPLPPRPGGELPRPEGFERAPRITAVRHVSGRAVYPYRRRALVSYSSESLARCVPLDPEGATVIAIEGRHFGDRPGGRTLRVSARGGRDRWTPEVLAWSDREIRLRIGADMARQFYDEVGRLRAGLRIELVAADGRVAATRAAPFCARYFELEVQLVVANCATDLRLGEDVEMRAWNFDLRPRAHRRSVRRDGERQYLTLAVEIREGRRFPVSVTLAPNRCRYGRWVTPDARMVGPAIHGRERIQVVFRHETEPVRLEVPFSGSLFSLETILQTLRLRLHNWPGNRGAALRNQSWVRIAGSEPERFTIPRFEAELGGIVDPAVPDLISFVNDMKSNTTDVSIRAVGGRAELRAEIGFEDEGVEIKNYANTGSDSVGDDLYPDAHLDDASLVVEGLALGWDAANRSPAFIGRARAQVDLKFQLRSSAGKAIQVLIEQMVNIERLIERTAEAQVEAYLNDPRGREDLNEALWDGLDGLREFYGLPPIARYVDARAEGDAYVVLYIPADA